MKIVDMHCDTIAELYQQKQGNLMENNLHIDIQKLFRGEYILQNFALYVNLENVSRPYEHCMGMLEYFYREIALWKDRIRPVTTAKEIRKNQQEQVISALLTIEEGAVCNGRVEHLKEFYERGVRMMTLTWNYPNQLANPNYLDGKWIYNTQSGLTACGIEFVEAMEDLGMIIDVSHLSDKGISEVLKISKKPFVASHSNARSLASHPRNLTDEMIRQMADRGCLIGINYCPAFLRDWREGEQARSMVTDIVRHMGYVKNIGGIDCLGLGSDFDGIEGHLEIADASCQYLLEREMKRQGFSALEIEKVCFRNVLDFYDQQL